MLRSLSHDRKTCDTLVYTSFFQPPLRRKQLGNWPNTYAKRLYKLANRTLVKRLVGETTVDRSPLPKLSLSSPSLWGYLVTSPPTKSPPTILNFDSWREISEPLLYFIFQRNDQWLWNFSATVFWSLKCQSLHSLNLYMYLYYYLQYQEHKTFRRLTQGSSTRIDRFVFESNLNSNKLDEKVKILGK